MSSVGIAFGSIIYFVENDSALSFSKYSFNGFPWMFSLCSIEIKFLTMFFSKEMMLYKNFFNKSWNFTRTKPREEEYSSIKWFTAILDPFVIRSLCKFRKCFSSSSLTPFCLSESASLKKSICVWTWFRKSRIAFFCSRFKRSSKYAKEKAR